MSENLEEFKQTEFPSEFPIDKFPAFKYREYLNSEAIRLIKCLQKRQKYLIERFEKETNPADINEQRQSDKTEPLSDYAKNELEISVINVTRSLAEKQSQLRQSLTTREQQLELIKTAMSEIPEKWEVNLSNARLRATKEPKIKTLLEKFKANEQFYEENWEYKSDFYLQLKQELYPSKEMTVSKGGQQN